MLPGSGDRGMRAQRVATEYEPTYVLVFDKGDDPVEGIAAFAREQQLAGAHFTGIGAFSDLIVGYFDREARDYRRIVIPEQVEVLSLTGDIALDQGEPRVHAHVVVGKSDGSAHGGHLLEAHVWPTLEVVLEQTPAPLRKRFDPETGLALIAPDGSAA
jgi:predicted DNA-binding protein with PD1-like motif